jgi:hypothetical protein
MFDIDDQVDVWKILWARGVCQAWFVFFSKLSSSSKQDLELSTLPLTQ